MFGRRTEGSIITSDPHRVVTRPQAHLRICADGDLPRVTAAQHLRDPGLDDTHVCVCARVAGAQSMPRWGLSQANDTACKARMLRNDKELEGQRERVSHIHIHNAW